MRNHWLVVTVAAAILTGSAHKAGAGMIGMPMQLRSVMQHVKLDTPTPVAATQVRQHGDDELSHGSVFDTLRVIEEIPERVIALNLEIGGN